MTEGENGHLVADLVAAVVALRCRCDRPFLLAAEDAAGCLKCGRAPALRLAAAAQPGRPATLGDDDGD